MSTRATIGLKQPDGKITAIILWHDACFDEAGRILKNYYDTREKVEELLAGGNLEQLGTTPDASEYQYRGDDGVPDDCKAATLRNIDAFTYQVDDFCQDWGYLFQDGGWFYYRFKSRQPLTPMP